jgi:hypothetical protein
VDGQDQRAQRAKDTYNALEVENEFQKEEMELKNKVGR